MTSKQKNALVLMAHADDETLGAGGTIVHLSRTGWDVQVVLLTDGEVSTRGDQVQDNRSAAYDACEILGAGEPIVLGFADQKFDTYPIADIVNSVLQLDLSPDLIITQSPDDLNGDHRVTFDVAKIVGRPRYKNISILSAEIPKNNFWDGQSFHANYYVDVTEFMDTKLKAFAAYENEAKEYPHAFSLGAIELLAKYHGFHAGYPMAEAFHMVRGYPGLLP